MKYVLLLVFSVFFTNCNVQSIKEKDAEIEKLTNENEELRKYIKNLKWWVENEQNSYVPIVTVSADLSVLYLGIDNPISIVVQGFLQEEISITVTNGSYEKTKRGWNIRPISADEETAVTVQAMINDTLTIFGTRVFRVVPLSPPLVYVRLSSNKEIKVQNDFYTKTLNYLSSEQLKLFKKLLVQHPLVDYEVLSFSMKNMQNRVIENAEGEDFTDKQLKMLARLKKGETIEITDIIAIGRDNIKRKLPPVEIQLGE